MVLIAFPVVVRFGYHLHYGAKAITLLPSVLASVGLFVRSRLLLPLIMLHWSKDPRYSELTSFAWAAMAIPSPPFLCLEADRK